MLASATRPIHHHQHLHHHPRLDQEQDTPANAHSSLLRLSRRHSVPASGILAFLPPDCPPASAPLVIPPATLQDRSPALSSGNVNRHRYGHRHTRSEVYDSRTNNPTPTTPIVVVKRYTPSKQEEQRRVHRGLVRRMLKAVTGADDELWDDDEDDVQLPAIGEFEWAGILRSVEPEGALIALLPLTASANACSLGNAQGGGSALGHVPDHTAEPGRCIDDHADGAVCTHDGDRPVCGESAKDDEDAHGATKFRDGGAQRGRGGGCPGHGYRGDIYAHDVDREHAPGHRRDAPAARAPGA